MSCSFQSFFPVYPADRQWSALMRKVRDSIRVPAEPDTSWENTLRERLYPSGNSIDLVPVSYKEIFKGCTIFLWLWDRLFPPLKQPPKFWSIFNHIAPRTAKTLWSFGHSECDRVNNLGLFLKEKTSYSRTDSADLHFWGRKHSCLIALRPAKPLCSLGRSECNRVKAELKW